MKEINTRIQQKYDLEENYSSSFTPLAGELIVLKNDDEHNYPRLKIGDGVSSIDRLGVVNGIEKKEIEKYINETMYGFIDGSIQNISNSLLKSIRDYNFYNHPNLITVNFPSVLDIGNYSFYKNLLLTEVSAESTLNIGKFAFKGDISLIQANFPLVKTLGQGAFDECEKLNSVNLTSLERVEPLTFRKCTMLATIDLPLVTSIGSQSFYNSGLTSLFLRSTSLCTLEHEDAFYFTPIEAGTGYIYVPAELVATYRSDSIWSKYANQILAFENYLEV